jgi:hypothetical protein
MAGDQKSGGEIRVLIFFALSLLGCGLAVVVFLYLRPEFPFSGLPYSYSYSFR